MFSKRLYTENNIISVIIFKYFIYLFFSNYRTFVISRSSKIDFNLTLKVRYKLKDISVCWFRYHFPNKIVVKFKQIFVEH